MIQTESKQIILSIVGISILIIAFVGISYAAFHSSLFSNLSNGISTGTISVSLKENSDVISMNNAMPMTDEKGMSLNDNNVYVFKVQSNLSPKTTLNYEVSLQKEDSKNMLDNNLVRFYLEKFEYKHYQKVLEPKAFIPLEKDSFLGSKKGSMVIYSGTLSNASDEEKFMEDEFKLRMWVSQDAIIDSVSRDFNVKLNVVAKAI